jgi:hypothetical protein
MTKVDTSGYDYEAEHGMSLMLFAVIACLLPLATGGTWSWLTANALDLHYPHLTLTAAGKAASVEYHLP